MSPKKYQDHELAEIFPLMSDSDLQALVEDIKSNGLRAPITLLDGKILDGRNRYRACLDAGIQPKFLEHKGDPITFVISANLHRRHLNESQRSLIGATISTMDRGNFSKSVMLPISPISQSEAAEKLNVSVSGIYKAKKVLENSPKKTVEAVRHGKKTVNGALKELKDREQKNNPPEIKDETGLPIPVDMIEEWLRAEKTGKELRRKTSEIKCQIETALEEEDLIWREVHNPTIAHAKNLFRDLEQIIPYAVCPTCQGHNRKKCTVCKQRGFISEGLWKKAFPKEVRVMREKQVAELATK